MNQQDRPICRICGKIAYAVNNEELYQPCHCTGPKRYAHNSCILALLRARGCNRCETCSATISTRDGVNIFETKQICWSYLIHYSYCVLIPLFFGFITILAVLGSSYLLKCIIWIFWYGGDTKKEIIWHKQHHTLDSNSTDSNNELRLNRSIQPTDIPIGIFILIACIFCYFIFKKLCGWLKWNCNCLYIRRHKNNFIELQGLDENDFMGDPV